MIAKYDYVVFDLDGTLLDTREGVIAAIVKTIEEYHFEVPNQSVLESLIGPPMQTSFKKMYGLSDEESMKMANRFRDYYKTDEILFQAKEYDGIYDLISSLIQEHIYIGVATYKREDYAKRLLIGKGFDKYTDYMYGSDFEGKLKKHDIIRLCLDEMRCTDYSRAVYVGDGKSDGVGAKTVGIDFIAVLYGFDFKTEEDAREFSPVGTARRCNDIKDIVLQG